MRSEVTLLTHGVAVAVPLETPFPVPVDGKDPLQVLLLTTPRGRGRGRMRLAQGAPPLRVERAHSGTAANRNQDE